MASPTDSQAEERVQRKRLQNREAQQKYRTRVKERMNALERQIKELKTQAKAPDAAFGEQQPENPTSIPSSHIFSDFTTPESLQADWFWDRAPTANENMTDQPPGDSASHIMLTPPSTCHHEHPPLPPPPALIGELLLSDDMMNLGKQRSQSHIELKDNLKGQPLETRLEFLHLCLTSAGFDTFDSVLSQYYTSTLSPDSAVSSHQRTSRQRGFPILLSELRHHSRAWSQWEVHGYCYEIIKSAESIASCERGAATTVHSGGAEFRDALQQLSKERGADSGCGSLSGALHVLMRVFQKTRPKLWALLESLVDSGDALTNQRQRFYTSLTLMLLLDPPKEASGKEMVMMLMNCIRMIHEND